MNAELLMRAIGLVGDDLIEKADSAEVRRSSWQRWAALAACAALIIGAAAVVLPRLTSGKGSSDGAATQSVFDTALYTSNTKESAPAAIEESACIPTSEEADEELPAAEDGVKSEMQSERILYAGLAYLPVSDDPDAPALDPDALQKAQPLETLADGTVLYALDVQNSSAGGFAANSAVAPLYLAALRPDGSWIVLQLQENE